MSRLAVASALALCAAAGSTARAQEAPPDDGALARDDVRVLEGRTWRLLRENGPSVLSVSVITRAASVPRLVLPGVVLAPPHRDAQRIDATGFVVSSQGHVVTTSAALRDAAQIEVRFSDGTLRDADVVGVDAPFRIAVLRTRAPENARSLCATPSATAAAATLGWFFQSTAGRPNVQIATVGAADDHASSYDRFLFAPVPLPAGAAGGPLVARDGALLGMAVADVAPSDAGDDVPGAGTLFVRGGDVAHAVSDIVRYGRVRRPLLGVVMDGDTNRIDQLLPQGPAKAAGLEEGDRVVGVAGSAISSLADLTRALLRRTAGDAVEVDVVRGDAMLRRSVVLTDAALPCAPTVAPLPGATLEVAAEAGPDGERPVTVRDVVPNSTLHAAGLRDGDQLLRVDGRSALRFLARFAIDPAASLPHALEIERDGARFTITPSASALPGTRDE